MAVGAKTTGWHRAAGNGALEFYYHGTKVGSVIAAAFDITGALTTTTSMAATTAITAGTGLTVTTGNYTVTAGDHRVTAGNARLGVVSTFATTEPTSAYVMKEGTNPVGAITTSGGVFVTTGGATISKIIAAGTVSQIET